LSCGSRRAAKRHRLVKGMLKRWSVRVDTARKGVGFGEPRVRPSLFHREKYKKLVRPPWRFGL